MQLVLWFDVRFFTFFCCNSHNYFFFSVRDAILYKYNAFFISVGTVEFIQVRIFFPIYGTIKAVSVQQLSS